MTLGAVPWISRSVGLALSIVLVSTLSVSSTVLDLSLGPLLGAAISELVLARCWPSDWLPGLSRHSIGGRILDAAWIRCGRAHKIPQPKAQVPLLGTLLYMAAVMGFSHRRPHLVLRAPFVSLQHLPPGTPYSAINIGAAVTQFGAMFSFAVAIRRPLFLASSGRCRACLDGAFDAADECFPPEPSTEDTGGAAGVGIGRSNISRRFSKRVFEIDVDYFEQVIG